MYNLLLSTYLYNYLAVPKLAIIGIVEITEAILSALQHFLLKYLITTLSKYLNKFNNYLCIFIHYFKPVSIDHSLLTLQCLPS